MAEIKTSRGDVILVDDEDYAELASRSWFVDGNGYAKRTQRVGPRREGRQITYSLAAEMLHGEFANAGN